MGGDLDRTIYIANIFEDVSEEVLYSVFAPFGEIKCIEIPKDHETGECRGIAFVEYEDLEDVEHAIENRNASELFGKVIKVQRAKKIRGPMNKAIWADKDYQVKYINDRGQSQENEIKVVDEIADPMVDEEIPILA